MEPSMPFVFCSGHLLQCELSPCQYFKHDFVQAVPMSALVISREHNKFFPQKN